MNFATSALSVEMKRRSARTTVGGDFKVVVKYNNKNILEGPRDN
jgi:hypothetical protein